MAVLRGNEARCAMARLRFVARRTGEYTSSTLVPGTPSTDPRPSAGPADQGSSPEVPRRD
jgi:hypothetical protein